MMIQASLFGDESLPEGKPALLPTHDLTELQRMIELVNGEPRILDTRLGAWLGFKDPLDARQGIRRSPMMRELSALGILAQRELNSFRRGRPTIGFLLNQAQANHYITHCGLPDLSDLRVLVTKVFTAYQSGHLAPTDAATEIDLQDAAVAAEGQMPGSATLGAEMARLQPLLSKTHDGVTNANEKLDRLEQYLADMQRSFDENVRQPRADELSSVVWQQHYVVAEHLDCWCPICRKIKILTVIERGADGLVSKVEKTDHYEHAHLLLRTVRGLFNTMPMCRQCNQTWERKLRHREWVVERVRSFHRLLREVWGILDLEGEQ